MKNSLTTLVVGTPAIAEAESKSCNYCGEALPKMHFVSDYDGHYCNEDCHRMYTED